MIVGGGLAAQRCAETLRRRGYEGPVRMVCAEPEPPYDRPPLSKELLAGAVEEESIAYRPGLVVRGEGGRAAARRPRRGARPGGPHASTSTPGPTLRYEKLLIATGGARAAAALPRGLRERPLPAHPRRRAPAAAGAAPGRAAGDRRRRLHRPGGRRDRARLGVEVTMIEALETPLAPILGEEVGALVRRPAR